ncbi:MAG: hypothetical protein JWN66_716 [Sphingomonas bacterium]|uniref:hypothetical protein n=1 Tax=Sphingomonas bacterium TaxID=1895847 RepID=UPI002606110B|nr:hypothetical protein [Sphingomonas bacterium]MDB5703600.1 hypothetical protein [Sphingomonas bacterium]
MENIDRRGVLIGSGLALAVAACSSERKNDLVKKIAPPFEIKSFDPASNQGKEPWNKNPNSNAVFKPIRTALIYIEFLPDFSLFVRRLHIPAVKTAGNAEWSDEKDQIVEWINFLNKLPSIGSISLPSPTPTSYNQWLGLKDFAFKYAHHVVFYFKNRTIDFNQDYPVWFGKDLRDRAGGVMGIKTASPNYSFFDGDSYDVGSQITGSWCTKIFHMKNYYQKYDGTTYKGIEPQDKFAYSLNLNIEAIANDGGGALLIFDPDTGNMGGGQP